MLALNTELGIDVAKSWPDISIWNGKQVTPVDNNWPTIKRFLKQLSTITYISLKSTNTYQEFLGELAIIDKHAVYMINAYRFHDTAIRSAFEQNRVSDAHLQLR